MQTQYSNKALWCTCDFDTILINTIATIGTIKEMDKQAIDHFANTHDINIKSITTTINNYIGSLLLSDHFGFVIEM